MEPRIVFLVLLFLAGQAAAQVPQGTGFTYQGSLRQEGTPVDGNVDIVFDLFDAASGGNAVGPSLAFTAATGNPVAVSAGVFNVTLDFGSPAFNGPVSEQRFLRVTVNGVTLEPRTPVQSAPYALQSRTAELAYSIGNGAIGAAQIDAAQVQRRISGTCTSGSSIRAVAQDGTVSCQSNGTGTITAVVPGTGLTGGGSSGSVNLALEIPLVLVGASTGQTLYASNSQGYGIFAASSSTSGYGIRGDASGSNGRGVHGQASATTGPAIGVAGATYSSAGVGVSGSAYESSGANFGVQGFTNSPMGTAVSGLNGRYAIHGVTAVAGGAGVRGEQSNGNGIGVWGTNPNDIGVLGEGATGVVGRSDRAGAAGVHGTNSANGFGVLGVQVVGPGGAGVRGVGSYAGVWGYSENVTGVLGQTAGGAGVRGLVSGSGIGVAGDSNYIGVAGGGNSGVASIGVRGIGSTGVRGESPATAGFGVAGVNNAGGTGTTWGVYGQTTSTGGYGVEGYNPNGIGVRGNGGTWAGQFIGNVQVQGSLSKSAGSFQIDHPLDPANRYLFHSFVESPDMKNIYDGVVVLDARGEATVELPAYFEALNRDFRYQLTAIGGPASALHIAGEIAGNRFRIGGGGAGQKVSWQVTGTRRDAYAEAHRITPEVDKPAGERGRYLYPALFGADATKAIHADSPLLPPSRTDAVP